MSEQEKTPGTVVTQVNQSLVSTKDEKRLFAQLLTPYSAMALARLFDDSGWTATKEVEILVDIANNSPRDSSKLGAIRLLQDMRKVAIEQSGVVTTVRDSMRGVAPDGKERQTSITMSGLLNTQQGLDKYLARLSGVDDSIPVQSSEEGKNEDNGGTKEEVPNKS